MLEGEVEPRLEIEDAANTAPAEPQAGTGRVRSALSVQAIDCTVSRPHLAKLPRPESYGVVPDSPLLAANPAGPAGSAIQYCVQNVKPDGKPEGQVALSVNVP